MNHSQHTELMTELRALRAVLERSADLAERLASPAAEAIQANADYAAAITPLPVVEVEAVCTEVDEAAGTLTYETTKPAPGAQRKRGERGGRGSK